MRIVLSDWRVSADSSQTLQAQESWPQINWQGQDIAFVTPVQLQFVLTKRHNSLMIHGEITAEIKLACSRCTTDFLLPLHSQVSEAVTLARAEEEDEYWDSSFIDRERDELNLSELSLQVLLESLPLQPLCSQDCRGLCSECGQDLNNGSCDCQSEQIDPRLAVLSQLLSPEDRSKK